MLDYMNITTKLEPPSVPMTDQELTNFFNNPVLVLPDSGKPRTSRENITRKRTTIMSGENNSKFQQNKKKLTIPYISHCQDKP